jgi:hypothetical protein
MTPARKAFQTEVELPSEGTPESLAEWTSAAPESTRKPKLTPKPWARFDKHAESKITFNLRLNDYERELLDAAAKLGSRSMQREAKRILIAGLEKALRGAKAEPSQSHTGAEEEP